MARDFTYPVSPYTGPSPDEAVLLASVMLQSWAAVLLLRANLYLLFPAIFFLLMLAYELKSGNALDLRWGKVVRKSDRPKAYRGMVGIKAAFILFLLYQVIG